jgi:uncharacterized surface protein with fasciclin (FAS1) repeats
MTGQSDPNQGVDMRRAPILIATAAATALLFASCGSDDEPTSSSSSATTEAAQPADDSPTSPETSSETITDIVAGNPEFSTLLAAVKAAGLAATLSTRTS